MGRIIKKKKNKKCFVRKHERRNFKEEDFFRLARELLNTMINWVVVEEEDRRQDG